MFKNLKERLLWRWCGWEGIVKMGLKIMEGHTYSSLANDRGKWEALVNTVMNPNSFQFILNFLPVTN